MIAADAPLPASTSASAGHLLDTRRLLVLLTLMKEGPIAWLVQAICGLRGHVMMMQFGPTRLSLQCVSCGRTTPGWDLGPEAKPQS
jgi:hypothetical protein